MKFAQFYQQIAQLVAGDYFTCRVEAHHSVRSGVRLEWGAYTQIAHHVSGDTPEECIGRVVAAHSAAAHSAGEGAPNIVDIESADDLPEPEPREPEPDVEREWAGVE